MAGKGRILAALVLICWLSLAMGETGVYDQDKYAKNIRLTVKPPGTCHFPPEGYAEIARLICPLVEKYNYGQAFDHSITPLG